MNQIVSTAGDAHAKALAVNLDTGIYGSIAEIGAGQEVARWFLTVGGASGTVAQTISAYDKSFSDATYGAGTRYVSRERLGAMLNREYGLLVERLGPARGATTRFFAFADTASARNYRGDNEQHAWVGLRFQTEPDAGPSEVVLHVNLTAPTATHQQQALGLLGVNLIHAVHYRRASVDDFLAALWDELTIDSLEIDVLDLAGPAFAGVDPQAVCLRLVRKGMAHAVVFDAAARVADPSSILRKRPVIVDPGTFATVEPFHEAMLEASGRQLRAEGIAADRDPVALLELSLNPAQGVAPDDAEILARVRRMASLGTVAVTDYRELYRLTAYLRRYTAEPIRFVIGVSLLARVLEDQFYTDLPGQLLEALGKLFASNVKVHVYPTPRAAVVSALGSAAARFGLAAGGKGVVTADDLHPGPPVENLYRYLREAGWVVPVGVG
jgi:hypothetical protein